MLFPTAPGTPASGPLHVCALCLNALHPTSMWLPLTSPSRLYSNGPFSVGPSPNTLKLQYPPPPFPNFSQISTHILYILLPEWVRCLPCPLGYLLLQAGISVCWLTAVRWAPVTGPGSA